MGKEIRHIPSSHDPKIASKFEEAMARTRASYQATFGEPPNQFWKQKSMLESLPIHGRSMHFSRVILLFLGLTMLACFPAFFLLKPLFVRIPSPHFQWAVFLLALVILGVLELVNRRQIKTWLAAIDSDSFLFHLHPFELIYLKTRNIKLSVHAGVNELLKNGCLNLVNQKSLDSKADGKPQDVFAAQILFEVNEWEQPDYSVLFPRILRKPVFQTIAACMDSIRKEFLESTKMVKLISLNCIALAPVILVAVSRITIGISRDKPVAFMILFTLFIVFVFAYYLYHLLELPMAIMLPDTYKNDEVKRAEFGYWDYFLLGSAVILPEFRPLVNQQGNKSDDGTWTSTASCGGSSCGGGCGGCGGS